MNDSFATGASTSPAAPDAHPGHGVTAARARPACAAHVARSALLALALVLAGCASTPTRPSVRVESDPRADLAAYRSFGFHAAPGTDRDGYESLVTRVLKARTRMRMEAKGYTYTQTAPELLINFNAHLADHVQITRTPVPPSEYYGYRSYEVWRDYDVEVEQYQEGTLNIDVVDARRGQLVWEGVATGPVTEAVRQDRQAAIERAVDLVLGEYPRARRP